MHEFLNSFNKLEFDKVKRNMQRYALSDFGREHIENLVPSSESGTIKRNLTFVSEMKTLLESDEPLPLDTINDIRLGLQRSSIENYVLSPEELRSISCVLESSRRIQIYFVRREKCYPQLFAMLKDIHINKVLEYNINQAIDEEGKVKNSASKELATVRRQIVERNESLRKNLESILQKFVDKGWAQEEIITTRDGRMVVPVKSEHKNHVPGFIHSSSSSGATVFIEPTETLELNNDILTLYFQEQREIEKILRELTNQVRGAKENILFNVKVLGELDFIYAKAKYSIQIIGAEPQIKSSGTLKLIAARHPILLQKHKREEVIQLDIEIGNDFNTLIITGPNAGGKSVAMKTAGLLSLLAQSGCHIPASPESEIRIFTDIFVDVGDEQSIENDLSSFSSHLSNLKIILENTNDSSLVLIDEIGSGTDPAEGSSLAAAILEKLSTVGCITIATTHHGMLKAFAFETPLIQNGAMEFDQETLRPTYRFVHGIPGSSYAIEMADRLDFPKETVARSKEFMGSDANKLENLIIDLEHRSQEMKRDFDEVQKDKNRLTQLIELYENRVSGLEREIREMKARALEEAQLIIKKANAAIENTVREIREHAAEKSIIKLVKEDVRQLEEEFNQLKKVLSPIDVNNIIFNIGDNIHLKNSNAVGEIVSIVDKDHYLVLIGDLKMRLTRDEIDLAPSPAAQRITPPSITGSNDIKREIDLRGMYGDEAISVVDKFIDNAILSGLHRVDIIHGKGTGSLRLKVTDYLKGNNRIKTFRLGEWNEGGTGVTVVELK
jgi:DNA mismatch repair protein MutS2